MSVSKLDIENILTLISKQDIESLKTENYDQFQYQGFDPLKLVASLSKIKNEKKIDDNEFAQDILKMVAIALIKGSITDKNINKMSDEGKLDVTNINSKYGIKMGGGRHQNSAVITYPRVMATFPDIAVRMTKVLGPKEFHGGPLLSSRLPTYMKVQVFPAIIPKNLDSNTKKMLLIASLCYSIDQSIQISDIKNPNLKQLASTQQNFTMIGHNSPVPSQEIRVSVFRNLSLSSDYDQIVLVLKDYKKEIDPGFEIMNKGDFDKYISSV